MSTDDAKTYLSKREIPRLFEVRNSKYVPKIAPDCLCFLKPQQNTPCFEFIVLTRPLKNTIIILSQHKTMMLQVTFYTNCQSFRLYLNNGESIISVEHSPRFLCRPTALLFFARAVGRQRALHTENSRFSLQLWVSTFPRFVAIWFYFLSETLI